MATHSSILAWGTLWREESGGLQSMGSQKSWTMTQQLNNSSNNKGSPEHMWRVMKWGPGGLWRVGVCVLRGGVQGSAGGQTPTWRQLTRLRQASRSSEAFWLMDLGNFKVFRATVAVWGSFSFISLPYVLMQTLK